VIPSHDRLIVRCQVFDKPDTGTTWPTWIDKNRSLVVGSVGCVVADYSNGDPVPGRGVEPVERYLSLQQMDR
jgi:hypothetical protein